MNNATDEIKNFISAKSNIPVNQLSGDTQMLASGIIRSLTLLELIAHLEKTFEVEIDQRDLIPENFNDIASLAQLMDRTVSGRSAAPSAE